MKEIVMKSVLLIAVLALGSFAILNAAAKDAEEPSSRPTVSGVVTLKGQPLKGRILFHTKDEQIFGCLVGDDGKYLVKRPQLGDFRVIIEGINSLTGESRIEREMHATIVPGTNMLNFELTDLPIRR
jgi:hypothetical protein